MACVPVSCQHLSEELWDPWATPQKTSPQPALSKRQEWFRRLKEQKAQKAAWQKDKHKGKAKDKKKDKDEAADWWSNTDGPDCKKWKDWEDWTGDGGSAGAAPWNDGSQATAAVK